MPDWSIDHISAVTLAVRDMAESVAFYERLGLHESIPLIAYAPTDE
jgi:Glyoxalase/Bleomycin resistance protein/Dioxygenase superfamily